MKIFLVERDIDGWGGKMKDLYFASYEQAKKCLLNTDGLHFFNDQWMVEGMKDCIWGEEGNSFALTGIQYPKEEQDDWSIGWCRVSIRPIELDFEIAGNELYLLKYCKGYRHWYYNSLFNEESNDISTIISYCRSKKQAKKKAARYKNLRQVPRIWVRPEEEKRISPIGMGENYLSIEKVVLQ